MPRRGYRSLVIPEVLYNRIKQLVDNSKGRYVSVAEIVREAVWKLLHEAT